MKNIIALAFAAAVGVAGCTRDPRGAEKADRAALETSCPYEGALRRICEDAYFQGQMEAVKLEDEIKDEAARAEARLKWSVALTARLEGFQHSVTR